MSSAVVVEGEDGVGGGEVLVCGFRQLVGQPRRWWVDVVDGSRRGSLLLLLFFFFFGSFVGCRFVIRGGHIWWSPVWEASLASLLAWG